ncbi:MAG: hypothetical protein KF911_07155 [Pseudomonadales bacterium]|nr:hypothetical protein [Pseudomonadales bacterium]
MQSTPPTPESLNADCFCIGTDLEQLRAWLEQDLARHGLTASVVETHPHLFAPAPVFVAREHVETMRAIVAAVERVAANPAYLAHVLAHAPPIARPPPAAGGILQGYDFHLSADGPQLIEINTNAGGAALNVELIRAQRACCPEVEALISGPNATGAATRIAAMFQAEWRRARGTEPLRRIAIVDRDPRGQYLYPEFLLFADLFGSLGIDTVIADPAELRFDGKRLEHAYGPIDLVYNRLTDFYFDEPANAVLAAAYRAGVVVTPNPHEHAVYASKRNLAVLCDPRQLTAWGVDPAIAATLARGVPRTEVIDPARADRYWAERDRLFFKPVAGFGSRGSYRGDKVTRKVFAEIMAGDYVAQALVPPGLRLHAPEAAAPLKFDIRLYAHRGDVLLIAARLYQGQTTNFRTPGGGFAAVYYPPDSPTCG